MSSRTCAYVAKKSDPESWHGTESSTFHLDRNQWQNGLGITEWHCPHPPLDQDDKSDHDSSSQYCVFHTDPEEVPDSVDECEALLDAIEDAGNGPRPGRPEHRGQFIGATFGEIDISGVTITATDNHDIRFDHAQFQSHDTDLGFTETTFVTEGLHPISFASAKFTTNGEGNVAFRGATFRTDSDGDVVFRGATFRTDSDGDVGFEETTFRTDGGGDVVFCGVTFRTNSEGHVWFRGATFRTNSEGYVRFRGATFQTNDEGHVWFRRATFRTNGGGDVVFRGATFRPNAEGNVVFHGVTFRTNGEGHVEFEEATFRTDGEGYVGFKEATFRTDGEGHVGFRGAILVDTDFRRAELSETDFSGVDLTGTDFREANLADISVNGATTCERLNEEHERDDRAWDATARAYHQLKNVFGDHGLVGRARNMHVRERHARSLEAKAANGWSDSRYLRSRISRVFTGYGVQVWNLVRWMIVLFVFSTVAYVIAEVEGTLAENISYSVLAFTVAPPRYPQGVGTKLVMMVETFFGTLSIVLLGYILGNRERF